MKTIPYLFKSPFVQMFTQNSFKKTNTIGKLQQEHPDRHSHEIHDPDLYGPDIPTVYQK